MRSLLIFATVLCAQSGLAAARAAEAPPPIFKVEPLTPAVALLVGPGGNVTVGHGAGGVVLVDAEVVQLAPQLIAAVRTLDPEPIKTVIDTHWHFDHVGGNEALAKEGAVIVAQANVRVRMAKGIAVAEMTIPPAVEAALPTRTYATSLSIAAGGDVLKLVHVPNAHTDGDTLVKWTRANILDMGDVYVRYGLPFVDLASGGSLRGFIAAVDKGLALSDARTVIVPGHGEPATRRDLVAYRDQLLRIAEAVEGQVRAGRSLAEVQALRLADGWTQGSDAFVKPDAFIAMAYESSQPRTAPRSVAKARWPCAMAFRRSAAKA